MYKQCDRLQAIDVGADPFIMHIHVGYNGDLAHGSIVDQVTFS